MKHCADLLRDFIDGSKTFNGFTFHGLYGMSDNNFIKMFRHFIETGENHLDEFSDMTYLAWNDNDGYDEYFPEEEREKIKKYLSGDSFWDLTSFVSEERLSEIKNRIASSEAHDEHKRTYKSRRRAACTHTGKKEVRDAVFEKHGEACLVCGSLEDIQIDHIVPVSKGGENEIENYQPLCRSCNISKGNRI